MCSDRNEKLLLVLITVYSYLTLPFDFSSGLHCPYTPYLGACFSHASSFRMRSIHRRQRKLLGHSFRLLCYCSTFAQFHELAHIAHTRTHTDTSTPAHRNVIDFPFFVSLLFVGSVFVRRMGVADGSFLYQFSTCGVKYDLHSFGSNSRVRYVQCACTSSGKWQRKEEKKKNDWIGQQCRCQLIDARCICASEYRVRSSWKLFGRSTSIHIALYSSVRPSFAECSFTFIRLNAQ